MHIQYFLLKINIFYRKILKTEEKSQDVLYTRIYLICLNFTLGVRKLENKIMDRKRLIGFLACILSAVLALPAMAAVEDMKDHNMAMDDMVMDNVPPEHATEDAHA